MNHVSENKLELLILDPFQIREEEKQGIEAHLRTCESCREIVEHFREFYIDMSRIQADNDLRTNAFIGELGKHSIVIPLKPFKTDILRGTGTDDYLTVLAAESVEYTTSRFTPVCAFYSQKDGLVVRIQRDNQALTYRLFLVANEPLAGRKATIVFPTLGIEVETDEQGRAEVKIPSSSVPTDWSTISAELRILPDA